MRRIPIIAVALLALLAPAGAFAQSPNTATVTPLV